MSYRIFLPVACVLLVTGGGSALRGAPTNNPLPNVPLGSTAVEVADFAVIPNSPGTSSRPRLNLLTPGPNGLLFVNDMRGPLYSLTTSGGNVTQYINVDNFPGLPAVRDSSGEEGFTSFAFHPNFNADVGTPGRGKLYVQYGTNTSGTADFLPVSGAHHDEVLFELTAADPMATTFAGTVREVLRIRQPFSNHNVGQLSFNPNAAPDSSEFGKLYFGVGDGGSAGDPQNLAQNLDRIFGKILRLDPLGNNSANGQYGIPADNPDIGGPGVTELDEIYAYGFRHPQRFSWDAGGSQLMFIGDIGQGVVEEIDIGLPGANYGWDLREGGFDFVNNSNVDDATTATSPGLTDPIAQYDHGDGIAVTAGYVSRGGPANLEGLFLFGDLVNGRVFYFDADNLPNSGQAAIQELQLLDSGVQKSLLQMIQETFNDGTGRADLRFGTGFNGEIFLLNKHDGTIRVLIPEPASFALLLTATAALAVLARRRRYRGVR